jgi:hypothetical protein
VGPLSGGGERRGELLALALAAGVLALRCSETPWVRFLRCCRGENAEVPT